MNFRLRQAAFGLQILDDGTDEGQLRDLVADIVRKLGIFRNIIGFHFHGNITFRCGEPVRIPRGLMRQETALQSLLARRIVGAGKPSRLQVCFASQSNANAKLPSLAVTCTRLISLPAARRERNSRPISGSMVLVMRASTMRAPRSEERRVGKE